MNNFSYKHLIPIFDHEHKTRFKHNINISLPNDAKVFGQKSIFYISLKLCIYFKINMINFNNLSTFKKYIKLLDLACT